MGGRIQVKYAGFGEDRVRLREGTRRYEKVREEQGISYFRESVESEVKQSRNLHSENVFFMQMKYRYHLGTSAVW